MVVPGSGDEVWYMDCLSFTSCSSHQQEDAEAEKLKQQRVEQYHEKKSQSM